jgi:hypothetical protein
VTAVYVVTVAAAWLIFAVALALALGRGIALDPGEPDEDPGYITTPAVDPDVYVNWVPVLPPVPPSRTADLPAWLVDRPTVPLTQGELDRSEDLLRGVS